MFFTPEGAQFVFVRASEFGKVKSRLTIHDSKTGKALTDYIVDIHVYSDFKVRSGGKTLLTIHYGGGAGGGGSTFSGISLFSSITTKEKVAEWDFAAGDLLWTFPEHTLGGLLSPDDKRMYSVSRGYIVTWRFDTHDELIQWACENRYMPEFTAQQRERFGIENEISLCKTLED
jgi:hypothetical protein